MYDIAQTKWNDTSQLFQQEITHMRHLLLLTIIYHNSCVADGVVHDKDSHVDESTDTVTLEGSRSQRSFVDKSCKIVDGMCLRTLLDLRYTNKKVAPVQAVVHTRTGVPHSVLHRATM